MPRPHVIDYEAFLPRLVAALRKAWRQVRAKRPDETFYLFGIETDSDITDLYPLCNTEEQYAADGGGPAPSISKWAMDDGSTLYRAGKKYTDDLARELNRYAFEDHSRDAPTAFLDRKRRLLRVFEEALVQLDDDGFFGTGKRRNRVLLQIAFVDPSEAEWKHVLKVIRRINPPRSTAEFFALLDEGARERDAEEQREREVMAIATEYLRRTNRRFDSCMHASKLYPELLQHCAKYLPGTATRDELWDVCFAAKGEPEGISHGPNRIMVLVDPKTGECAIQR